MTKKKSKRIEEEGSVVLVKSGYAVIENGEERNVNHIVFALNKTINSLDPSKIKNIKISFEVENE